MWTRVALCLLPLAASAAPRRAIVSDQPPPVVLVIRSSQTPAGQRHERKLYDELSLVLDGFAVLSEGADRPDFSELPLAEQLASVLPQATRDGAMVVVWLSFPLPQQMLLHVIAIGSGRALIRTIETNRSPVSESTLALMARELLGTAYLFESPKNVPVAVTEVVEKVKESIPKVEAPAPASPPPVAGPSPWSLWVRSEANYPLAGGADAVPVWGLAVGLERELPGRVEAGLALSGTYGGVDRPQTESARYFTAGGVFSAYRGFGGDSLNVGPWASASLAYATFRGPQPALDLLLSTFELGAQARSTSAGGGSLAVSLAASYAPRQAELRDPAGDVLYRTAALSLMLGLSAGWRGL